MQKSIDKLKILRIIKVSQLNILRKMTDAQSVFYNIFLNKKHYRIFSALCQEKYVKFSDMKGGKLLDLLKGKRTMRKERGISQKARNRLRVFYGKCV
jgi:hypothetical protein